MESREGPIRNLHMQNVLVFPEDESAGILFAADRAYCLDDSAIEWIGEAMGTIPLPQSEYVGLIFNNNVSLRRKLLREIDLSCIQILYFHNPFELLFDELIEDLGQLERAVLNCDPDDEDCALLSSLPGLRAIDLTESNISDQGLKLLCDVQSLESLVVSYTGVTDYGLDCLSRLIDLRELDLSLSMITDAGMPKLVLLKTLEELRLSATAISDDGIPHLLSLQKLRYLDLTETAVSEEGIATLQTGLSDCQISF